MRQVMLLDVDEEKLRNKNYNMSALALANMSGYVDKKYNCRVFYKSDFKNLLKRRLKIGARKVDVILNTFEEIGCLKIEGDICKLNPVKGNGFLKIDFETAKYCLNCLSPLAFKVYCYLFNKYNIHLAYEYLENYCFSKKELLKMAGYSYSYRNSEIMEQCLQTLKSVGLLEFSDDPIFKVQNGHPAPYRELYKANLKSHAQIVARKEVDKEFKKDLSLTSGEIIMELEMLKDKGVKKLYNGHLGGDTDIDKLIDMVNVYPTGAKCYLEYSRNKDENKEVYEKYLEEF